MMILEIKGQDSPQNKQKRQVVYAWVAAVNQKGGFGVWCWDVAFEMGKIRIAVKARGQEVDHSPFSTLTAQGQSFSCLRDQIVTIGGRLRPDNNHHSSV